MKRFKNRFFTDSLFNAVRGFFVAVRRERNLKIHILIAIIVIVAGVYFKISRFEWIAIVFAINIVILSELINTAIELTIDLYTKKYRETAKLAKDIAAGAVLVSSTLAIVIGLFVFYNKVITFIGNILSGR
ncbi:MAG: hypothetical protein A2Y40_07650 [Candidatus Margulisbacteria bacterium GWF2_35_9]|nr:MAG: hypothetical protein A2Y40_07650 [Candidatus Margulisbacteria bacterium GWF2_35_9]